MPEARQTRCHADVSELRWRTLMRAAPYLFSRIRRLPLKEPARHGPRYLVRRALEPDSETGRIDILGVVLDAVFVATTANGG